MVTLFLVFPEHLFMVSFPTGLPYWPNSSKSKELPWKLQQDAKEKEESK